MASKPPISSDPRDEAFLREVDEEYRRAELSRFFNRYGRWILLAVGLGLALLGGWLFWRAEQGRRIDAVSESYAQALEKISSGATADALPLLEPAAQSNNDAYRALSVLARAGVAQNDGNDKEAAELLASVADDGRVPAALRDAARMKLVRLQFDDMAPADVIATLQPYLEGDHAWFPVAGELAAFAHLKAGDTEKAGPLFLRVAADDRTPRSLAGRAEQMAAMLGQDVTKLAEERRQKAEAAVGEIMAAAPSDDGESAMNVETAGEAR